jgi:hypothetical protein
MSDTGSTNPRAFQSDTTSKYLANYIEQRKILLLAKLSQGIVHHQRKDPTRKLADFDSKKYNQPAKGSEMSRSNNNREKFCNSEFKCY